MTTHTSPADAQPATSATPDAAQMPAPTRRRLKSLFTPDQLAVLTARSDVRGAWAIASTWGVIAAAFAVLALWPTRSRSCWPAP